MSMKKITITFHSFSTFFFLFLKANKKFWGGRFFIGAGGDENLKIYLVWPKDK